MSQCGSCGDKVLNTTWKMDLRERGLKCRGRKRNKSRNEFYSEIVTPEAVEEIYYF